MSAPDTSSRVASGSGSRRSFVHGFVTMVPLWAGVVPFAAAFAVLARGAGFSLLQTQLLSAGVFAGSAQVAIVTLKAAGSAPIPIALTAILLNLRHILYGLSLSRMLGLRPRPPRPVLAFLLTDEVYGLTIRAFSGGEGSGMYLVGAGLSLYLSFNAATLAGSMAGAHLPDPRASGFDFIFPLTFLALLIPLLRSPRQILVAVVAGATALLLSHIAPSGVTILGAAAAGLAVAAVVESRAEAA